MDIKKLLEPNFDVHIVCNEKENYTKVSGTIPNLLTALSCFVSALKKNEIDDEMIKYAVNQGLMNEKELDEELKKKLDELMRKIFE